MKQTELSNADFGLIGYPLGHSFSKNFFTRLFEMDGSGRSYENFELEELTPETLYRIILLNPNLKGFNVTAPYKERIIAFLDKTDPVATKAGAVNTVKIIRAEDGRLTGLEGYNTDIIGFHDSIIEMHGAVTSKRALILGTGGAAKAVAVSLESLGIVPTFVSRSKKDSKTILYSDIDRSTLEHCRLIVNATPAGTYPDCDNFPPFPYGLLTEANYCHDLVYNPEETLFMKKAAAHGAKVKNGLDMLFGQAIASLKIWTSK